MRLVWASLLIVSWPVFADVDSWSYHGYVAQGVAKSQNSDFIDERGELSSDLTEVGINVLWNINEKINLVAQGVYLNGGNRYPEGARLDYAFIDYQVDQSSTSQTNIHLGRYKNRHWLYSATRDIPQTRASIILPQSVYFDGFRDISLSSDGIAIISNRNIGGGDLTLNWSFGRSDFSSDLTQSLIGPDALGESEQRYVHQFSAFWAPPSLKWQVGFSLLDSEFNYRASVFEQVADGKTALQRGQFSLRYSSQKFEMTSEFFQESVEVTGPPIVQANRTGQGGYLQLQYFAHPNFSAILRYDTYYLDKDDRDGTRLSALFNGEVPDYFGFLHTSTIGMQWNINDSWRVQLEHHWFDGGARIRPIVIPPLLPSTDEHWRVFALQVMTWF